MKRVQYNSPGVHCPKLGEVTNPWHDVWEVVTLIGKVGVQEIGGFKLSNISEVTIEMFKTKEEAHSRANEALQ